MSHPHPDTLYRYTKLARATPFVEEGRVYFTSAAKFGDSSLTVAQRDNEHKRQLNLDMAKYELAMGQGGEPHANTLQNLTEIKVTYTIKSNGEFLCYRILCLSLTADDKFYSEFGADCLITINNPEEFWNRLSTALREQLPGHKLVGDIVEYYDPKEFIAPRSLLDCCFLKDKNDYGWQTEYRIALFCLPEEVSPDGVELVLGSLTDICTITTK